MKTLRTLAVSLFIMVAIAVSAAPAFAADQHFPKVKVKPAWYHWGSYLFVASALGLIAMLIVGYTVKVLIPKYRGR